MSWLTTAEVPATGNSLLEFVVRCRGPGVASKEQTAGGAVEAADADPGPDGRGESPSQRADRNWNDLLQEFRVLQTGVQLLSGFLLAIPARAVRMPDPTSGSEAH